METNRLFTLWLPVVAMAWALLPTLAAQDRRDTSGWSDVLSLTPGSRVEIRGLTKKDRADGRVTSVSADSLTLTTKNGERTFGRSQTRKVEIVKRQRNLWFVMGGASMVGAALATSLATAETSTYCFGRNCAAFPRRAVLGGTLS
jgi:hypothetical protein